MGITRNERRLARRRLKRLMPRALAAAEASQTNGDGHAITHLSHMGAAFMPQVRLVKLAGLHICRTETGRVHVSFDLRDMPEDSPNVIGTPKELTLKSEAAAESWAVNQLAALILAEKRAGQGTPPTPDRDPFEVHAPTLFSQSDVDQKESQNDRIFAPEAWPVIENTYRGSALGEAVASLGTLPDGSAIGLTMARLSAPHSFIMGGTGAGKSSTIARLCEIASDQGVPLLVIDPEGQFGALKDSCPGIIIIGGDGDIPIDVDRIEHVVQEGLRNRASLVLQLDDLPEPLQRRVVAKVLNVLRTLPNDSWHHRLVVIDEVHIFAPQKGVCESSLPLAEVAARGRRRGIKLVCATQRFSRVAKDLVSQCGNILVGKINAAADLAPAIDTLGLRREDANRLRLLERGCFMTMGPDLSPEPVELCILKPRTILGKTLEIDSGHASDVLTGEELLEAMRTAHAGNVFSPSGSGVSSVSRANDGEETPSSGAKTPPVQPETMELCLALIASSPDKALPDIVLPLLMRTDATKKSVEHAIRQARRLRLITGRKRLVITASGKASLSSTSLGPNVLAERIGMIRMSITRQMQPILDIIAAFDGSTSVVEIARLGGYPETSRKLRRLLEQLGRVGLIHRRRGCLTLSPAYAALVKL